MTESAIDYSKQPLAVEVKDVTMIFNMASESLTNLKEYFIKLAKHELFFEEFRALKHISFDVHRGEVVGLVGTNGSGKSTMLKIIAGVLEPSEGEVKVHGNIAPLIELGAGFDPELTARENLYLNGALLGYTKEFIDAHFDGIIDFAELDNFVDMPLKNFSSGMIARIAFAIATITEPDILIVDETLSVGDVFFQEKCERRIQHFIESGDVTVLFVSHSMEQVERICQRAIWIEKGELRMDGPVRTVCSAYHDQFSSDFIDVDRNSKYAQDINWMVEKRITRGWAIDNTHREFRGKEKIKRQDFATFVFRLVKELDPNVRDGDKNQFVNPFLDVDISSPGSFAIYWLKNEGYLPEFDAKRDSFYGDELMSSSDAIEWLSLLQRHFSFGELIDYGVHSARLSREEAAHLLRIFYDSISFGGVTG